MEVPPGTRTKTFLPGKYHKHGSSPVHEHVFSLNYEHGFYALITYPLRIRCRWKPEADPVWEDHIEYCVGCEICEIAVRMWKTAPNPTPKKDDEEKREPAITLELRFHSKCLSGF